MSTRIAAYLVAAALFTLSAAAECSRQPEPKPSDSTLCGTTPDGVIYCQVPAPTATTGIDPK